MHDATTEENSSARERFLIVWGKNQVGGLQCAFGPATTFRSVGPSLRLGSHGEEVARFYDGLWINVRTGGCFPCLWTETSSLLGLENPTTNQSLTLGTFAMIGVMGNTVYVERENSRAVATLDERGGFWRTSQDERKWPDLTLRPASPFGK